MMSSAVPGGGIGAELFDLRIILYKYTHMKNNIFVTKPNSEFKKLENFGSIP